MCHNDKFSWLFNKRFRAFLSYLQKMTKSFSKYLLIHSLNFYLSGSTYFVSKQPTQLIIAAHNCHNSPSRSTPSKSLKKPAKRPAPYAKNKPVLAKRKDTSSSSGYSSMVKLPTNAWTTPPPQPSPPRDATGYPGNPFPEVSPPIMMPNQPTNLEISQTYVEDPMPILMPNPTTNLGMSPIYVQDPMPAIMGLAHHQSWKPKVRN